MEFVCTQRSFVKNKNQRKGNGNQQGNDNENWLVPLKNQN